MLSINKSAGWVPLTILLYLVFATDSLAQLNQLSLSQQFRMGSGIIRISEQGVVSDTVNVWGDLQSSGRFMIPRGSTISQLISYSGGPVLFRSGDTVIDWSVVKLEVTITHTYVDSLSGDNVTSFIVQYDSQLPSEFINYKLRNNDIIIVQVKRRRNWRDYLGVIAPIASTLTTIILIYDRVRN